MRKFLLFMGLMVGSTLAHATGAVNLFCEDGNVKVVTGGLTSTTTTQGSYPRCAVTVNVHGGGLATIYSDSSNTPLANPFTANTDGSFVFWASGAALYDVVNSSSAFVTMPTFTRYGIAAFDPASFGCGTAFCQGGNNFGVVGVLGTTDRSNMSFVAHSLEAFRIDQSNNTPPRLLVGLTDAPSFDTAKGSILATGGYYDVTTGGAGASWVGFHVVAGVAAFVSSGVTTGGTFLPIKFFTNNAATLTLDTSNNATVAGSLTAASLNTTGTASIGVLDEICAGVPTTPAVGHVKTFCRSSDNKLYYVDSGGSVTGPLGSGGGGGPFWNASTTLAGTNSLSVITYIGGNNTAGGILGFTTNQLERGRLTNAGLWGFNTTTPGRVVEVADTSGGIPMRLTGPATSGAGTTLEFYETTTSAGQITVAKNNTFTITGVGATPINLATNSNVVFTAYRASGDSIGQFLGGAEWNGTATGAVGLSGASKGRIIYNSTLNHFYASENGGAYFQLNAGSGGTGWPIGSAANSGTYNNPGAGPYFIGLLNTGVMGFTTQSIEAMRITTSQQVLIGATSGGPGTLFVENNGSGNAININSTSGNTVLGWQNSGTVNGQIISTSTSFNVDSVTAIPVIFKTNNTFAAQFDGNQRFTVNTTTPFNSQARMTVQVGAGDNTLGLALIQPTAATNDTLAFVVNGVEALDVYSNGTNSFFISHVGSTFIGAPGAVYLQSSGVTGLTLDATLNVGVGITSPLAPLHVKGSGGTTGILRVESNNASSAHLDFYGNIGKSAWVSAGSSSASISLNTVGGNFFSINDTSGSATSSVPLSLPSYTIAGLPSGATVGSGTLAWVSDGTPGTSPCIGPGGGALGVVNNSNQWVCK